MSSGNGTLDDVAQYYVDNGEPARRYPTPSPRVFFTLPGDPAPYILTEVAYPYFNATVFGNRKNDASIRINAYISPWDFDPPLWYHYTYQTGEYIAFMNYNGGTHADFDNLVQFMANVSDKWWWQRLPMPSEQQLEDWRYQLYGAPAVETVVAPPRAVATPKRRTENEYAQWQREMFGHVHERAAQPVVEVVASPVVEYVAPPALESVVDSGRATAPNRLAARTLHATPPPVVVAASVVEVVASPSVLSSVVATIKSAFTAVKAEPDRAEAAASPPTLESIRAVLITANADPEQAEAVLASVLKQCYGDAEPDSAEAITVSYEPVVHQLTRVEPEPVAEPAPPPAPPRNMAPNRLAAHIERAAAAEQQVTAAAPPSPVAQRNMAPSRLRAHMAAHITPPPPPLVAQPVADSALLRRMAALLASAQPAATLALPSPLEQPVPDFTVRKERTHVK